MILYTVTYTGIGTSFITAEEAELYAYAHGSRQITKAGKRISLEELLKDADSERRARRRSWK